MKKEPTLEARNARVREWLKDHPLINIAALCRAIDYNRGAFWHFEDGKQDLGIEATERLESALKKYGYDGKN